MVAIIPTDDDPAVVDVHVSKTVRATAEFAAIVNSKTVDELVEQILVDYLVKTGHLHGR